MNYLVFTIIILNDILCYWESLFNSMRLLGQYCMALSVLGLFQIIVLVKYPTPPNQPIAIQSVRSNLCTQ